MRLDTLPFEQVKNGEKSIETRLNDEKRRKLKIGDSVEFHKRPEEKEKVRMIIKELLVYKTFSELFDHAPAHYFGGRDKKELLGRVSKHYSKESENHYGAVGIRMELLA